MCERSAADGALAALEVVDFLAGGDLVFNDSDCY